MQDRMNSRLSGNDAKRSEISRKSQNPGIILDPLDGAVLVINLIVDFKNRLLQGPEIYAQSEPLFVVRAVAQIRIIVVPAQNARKRRIFSDQILEKMDV